MRPARPTGNRKLHSGTYDLRCVLCGALTTKGERKTHLQVRHDRTNPSAEDLDQGFKAVHYDTKGGDA